MKNIYTNPVKDFTSVDVDGRKDLNIKAGDTVKVHVKITEKNDKGKERVRIQIFEGLVLSRKHGNEPGATITVRKTSMGVGVERIFPVFSPNIDKIEVVKRGKTRKSKLYYIRDKVNKAIRRVLRKVGQVELSTKSEMIRIQEEKKVEEEQKKKEEQEKKTEEVEIKKEDKKEDK